MNRAVRALDRLRDKVEEWGVVTISAPVAVFDSDAFHVRDDIVSPQKLYEDARTDISATAVQATERAVSNQLTAVGTATVVPGLPKPPKGGTATQTTTTSTAVTSPQPRTIIGADGKPIESLDAEALPVPDTAITGGVAAVTAPFGLLSGLKATTKSVTASLREAQDNTIRQKLYSQMSRPRGIEGHSTVIFAIVQVSCNPGWRTKQHYIADCSASLEYYDMCERWSLSRGAQKAPQVFSVLPLIDAQTVEMANSQREVTQLAFQLAASLPAKGVDIKAKDLFRFVKQYSRDLRSVTPIPVVNSYSSGGTFGFRFSPSFQALSDPAQKHAKAANVLLPTTFPALITVVMHDVDVRAASRIFAHRRGEKHPAAPEIVHDMAIMTHVSTRWNLKDRPPLWQFGKRLFTPMRRDTASIEVGAADDVAAVYGAKEAYWRRTDEGEQTFNPVLDELRREIIDLESKGLGRSWPIALPANPRAVIKAETERAGIERQEHNEKLKEENEALRKKIKELGGTVSAVPEPDVLNKPISLALPVAPEGVGDVGLFPGELLNLGTEDDSPPPATGNLKPAPDRAIQSVKSRAKLAVTDATGIAKDLSPALPEK